MIENLTLHFFFLAFSFAPAHSLLFSQSFHGDRDLGMKWPYWHTLVFSDETKTDMRYVCPKDVKKRLVQRARPVYWKKWAAKHEYVEFKEGAWLEPGAWLGAKERKRRLD